MCCSRSHIQSKAFQTKREILPFALLWILGIHLKSVTNSLKWKRNIKTIFLLFFFPKPVSRHVLNKKWSITMPNNSHSKNDYKTGFIIIIITIKHISRWFFFFVFFFLRISHLSSLLIFCSFPFYRNVEKAQIFARGTRSVQALNLKENKSRNLIHLITIIIWYVVL